MLHKLKNYSYGILTILFYMKNEMNFLYLSQIEKYTHTHICTKKI